nr:MAG TPA: Putative transferase, nesg, ydcK, Structural Genomics.38A [Caudoviricetes sp.]
MKKYRLTEETTKVGNRPLYRIQALRDFGNVKEGDIGGYIESEKNLSQDGNAWVSGDARVYGDACVYGNARVYGDARFYGNADIKKTGDICSMSGFGSEYRTTTAFRTKNGDVHVSCGCFQGNLEAFCQRVESTHGNNLYGREYKKMIEMLKIHFEVEP